MGLKKGGAVAEWSKKKELVRENKCKDPRFTPGLKKDGLENELWECIVTCLSGIFDALCGIESSSLSVKQESFKIKLFFTIFY